LFRCNRGFLPFAKNAQGRDFRKSVRNLLVNLDIARPGVDVEQCAAFAYAALNMVLDQRSLHGDFMMQGE
jgi:hypothetical protein